MGKRQIQDKKQDKKEELKTRLKQMSQELERTKEQLRQANNIKQGFISTVSHELRTPLTSISEGVNLILDRVLGEVTPRQEEFLKIVDRNVKRLTYMVSDLLDFSTLESGKANLTRSCCHLRRLLVEVTHSRESQFLEKKIRFSTEIPLNLFPVFIDSGRILQVVHHLLDNALRFTPESGRVVVSADLCQSGEWGIWQEMPYVRVTISDTGGGLSKSEQEKLFVTFQQINRQVGPGSQGIGLGLVICHEIIERHGGRIWAESEIGKGSRFSFTVPVYTPDLELSCLFDEFKVLAKQGQNSILLMLISLEESWKRQNCSEEKIMEFHNYFRNQIRSKDRIFYHPEQKTVYLLAISEHPAELGLLRRIERMLQEKSLGATIAWSFYPEEGHDLIELRERAFQRAKAA